MTKCYKAVPNTSKILKRKQITTHGKRKTKQIGCSQYVKDTKKKANHNLLTLRQPNLFAVPNTSKILKKRKQIKQRQVE